MTALVWVFLGTTGLFVGLYTVTRVHVEQLRDRLEDAWQQRDDGQVSKDAADAKAAQCARLLRAVVDGVPGTDAFLMAVEADLDPEAHALADVLSANDATDESEAPS